MTHTTLITAAGLADHTGLAAAPGALLLETGAPARVLAAGSPRAVASHPASAQARRVSDPDAVLIPALINAHAHLDLTSIGPCAYDAGAGFAAWLDMVRQSRANDPQNIHNAVRLGVERSLAGGVVAVGDIAGSMHALEALTASPLFGVSFLELFGLTNSAARHAPAIAHLREIDESARSGRIPSLRQEPSRVSPGLQPHAPYSAGTDLYRASTNSGLPVATHLAESLAERELLTRARGPIRDFLASLDLWTPDAARSFGHARSSVAHLAEIISAAPMLLAHVNDADDADLELLARTECSVVYCPRAHEYFDHHHDLGPHRYRDMLGAGINVALGTDSVINLPAHEAHRLSTLDEIRLLWRRDGADPLALLGMATVNGARALGLEPSMFELSPGPIAGIAAVDVAGTNPADDPLRRVLEAARGVRLLTMDAP